MITLLLIVCVVTTAVLFVSCDDKNNVEGKAYVYDTYKVVYDSSVSAEEKAEYDAGIKNNYLPQLKGYKIAFDKGGEGSYTVDSQKYTFKWTQKDDKVTIVIDDMTGDDATQTLPVEDGRIVMTQQIETSVTITIYLKAE